MHVQIISKIYSVIQHNFQTKVTKSNSIKSNISYIIVYNENSHFKLVFTLFCFFKHKNPYPSKKLG